MAGSSWPLAVVGSKLVLGFEFVAQVVEGVVFTISMGAEGCPVRGDQVVQVGQVRARRARAGRLRYSSGIVSSALELVPMAETASSCRLATS